MANTYYDPGTKRAEKVNDLFQRIAPRYDLINDLQSFGSASILETATGGSGEPWRGQPGARLLLRHRGYRLRLSEERCGGRRSGLQRSHAGGGSPTQGLAPATGTAPQDRRLNVTFVQGDAMATGMPSAMFDIATVGYGLRNLSDWKAGHCRNETRPEAGGADGGIGLRETR